MSIFTEKEEAEAVAEPKKHFREWTLLGAGPGHGIIHDGPFLMKDEKIRVVEYSAYESRERDAKAFCKAYDNALQTIVELKTRLGEDPADY